MSESTGQDLRENFEDLFESSLCGNLIVDTSGFIIRCNAAFAGWLGYAPEVLQRQRFSSLLSIGGKIYFETHLAPLLRMQGHFAEIAVELVAADGRRVPVLINALERKDTNGVPTFVRMLAYLALDRQTYEQNLLATISQTESKLLGFQETSDLREQFIAVLGHDLRNPLGAITMGTALLSESPDLGIREKALLQMMEESARRMNELIENALDFARGRLGGGMKLMLHRINLEPVLSHAVEELRTMHHGRKISVDVDFHEAVECDPARIAQLLSNLVANALTHGSPDHAVKVRGHIADALHISVSNQGKAISPDLLGTLFEPFTREKVSASQNGLGLGLYIASEIARAHGGELTVISTAEETRFTFSMPHVADGDSPQLA